MQRHGGTGKSIDREITDPAAVERNSGSTPIAGPGRTVMPLSGRDALTCRPGGRSRFADHAYEGMVPLGLGGTDMCR